MAIPVTCPSCGFEGEIPDDTGSQTVLCPECRANIPVPGSITKTSERFREEAPPERKRQRPVLDDLDDLDDAPGRRRSSRAGIDRLAICRSCGSDALPIRRNQISQAGWIVFALLLIFLPCLCWIGLFMKEEQRICAACGARL